jgi:rare lipoprotein A
MRPCLRLTLLLAMTGLAACTAKAPQSPQPPPAAAPPQPLMAQPFFTQTGLASFYAGAHDGNATADGENFNQHDFTAAHRTLAFGTRVRVTNLDNGLTVNVEITDRGPHIAGRIIDLSSAAAHALGMEKKGVSRVRLEAFRAGRAERG